MNNKKTYLSGGRVTHGVYRVGDEVHRPHKPNSEFVSSVLKWGHDVSSGQKPLEFIPDYLGRDDDGWDIYSFLEGTVPDNLGDFSDGQICAAAKLIRRLHDYYSCGERPDFLRDLPDGQTVCHNDLSPCNFTFVNGMPAGIIDFDACACGKAVDDLAYAMWMWLDIGNDEIEPETTVRRILAMSDAYGGNFTATELIGAMRGQMRRVADSIFPDPAQTIATRKWADGCERWLNDRIAPILIARM